MEGDRIVGIKIGEEMYSVTMRPKEFRTGSKGFYVWGKIVIDGKKHQVSGNFVEIGSKPTEE